MALALDLTLPATVPEMQQYHDSPERILPFALYALCDLEDEALGDVRRQCVTDIDDDMIRLPPRVRFVGQTVHTIVDYHVQLGLQGEFDPTYFLVYTRNGSKTILIVTLDDHDIECKPDKMWTNVNQSGLLLVNLQIANTDWFEAKEGDGGLPDEDNDSGDDTDGDNDNDNDGNDGNDDDYDGTKHDRNNEDGTAQDATTSHVKILHEDYGPPPPVGFHVQVYLISGIDRDALIPKLEPMSYMKKPDQSDWVCKPINFPEDSKGDPCGYAAGIHPSQCSKHPTLDKKFFIVVDAVDYEEEGVSIVRIDWDGNMKAQTEQQLLEYGRKLMFETQRAEVSDTGKRAAVATVCLLAQKYITWHPKVKQFAAYFPEGSHSAKKLTDAMDTHWDERGHGEKRIVFGGYVEAEAVERDGGLWPALIKLHITVCRRHKFVPEFVKEFFIYGDDENPIESSQVRLVKLDWDGELRQVEGLVANYRSRATKAKVTASMAHQTITDVIAENLVWTGEAVA